MANKDTSKQWFQTGDYPTQAQFYQVFDWLRWKDEGIGIEDVAALQGILNSLQLQINNNLPNELIAGGNVSIGVDDGTILSIHIPETKYKLKGSLYTQAAGTFNLALRPSSGMFRIDVFYLDATGLHIITGAISATPIKPAVPGGVLELGNILIGFDNELGVIQLTYSVTMLEFDNLASFPPVGETGKIYVAKDTNYIYRWAGSAYIKVADDLPSAPESGEKVITMKPDGLKADYDIIDARSATATTAYTLSQKDWSSGTVTEIGVAGEWRMDSNWIYKCVGSDSWIRIPHGLILSDLYLASVDDSSGVKTSGEMSSAYPDAVTGQRVRGNSGIYEYLGLFGWFYFSSGELPGDSSWKKLDGNLYYDDGNVGVGVTNPREKLHIAGNFEVSNPPVAGAKSYRFRTSGSGLDFEGAGASMFISMFSDVDYQGEQYKYLQLSKDGDFVRGFGPWYFHSDPLIPGDGYVAMDPVHRRMGVGTDEPRKTLDVVGDALLDGGFFVKTGGAPASSSADGEEGEIRFDSDYMYRYVGGKWKRCALLDY